MKWPTLLKAIFLSLYVHRLGAASRAPFNPSFPMNSASHVVRKSSVASEWSRSEDILKANSDVTERRTKLKDPRYSVVMVAMPQETHFQTTDRFLRNSELVRNDADNTTNEDDELDISWQQYGDIIGGVVRNTKIPDLSDKMNKIKEYIASFRGENVTNNPKFHEKLRKHLDENVKIYELFGYLPTERDSNDNKLLIQLIDRTLSNAHSIAESSQTPYESICATETTKNNFFKNITIDPGARNRLCNSLASLAHNVGRDIQMERNAIVLLKYEERAIKLNHYFMSEFRDEKKSRLQIEKSILKKTYIPFPFLAALLQLLRYHHNAGITDIAEWRDLVNDGDSNPSKAFVNAHSPAAPGKEFWQYVSILSDVIGYEGKPFKCVRSAISESIGILLDTLQKQFQSIPSDLAKLLNHIRVDLRENNLIHSGAFHDNYPSKANKRYSPRLPELSGNAVENVARNHFASALQLIDETRLASKCGIESSNSSCKDQHSPFMLSNDENVSKKKKMSTSSIASKNLKASSDRSEDVQPLVKSPEVASRSKSNVNKTETLPLSSQLTTSEFWLVPNKKCQKALEAGTMSNTPTKPKLISSFGTEFYDRLNEKWVPYVNYISKVVTNKNGANLIIRRDTAINLIKSIHNVIVDEHEMEMHILQHMMDYEELKRTATEQEDADSQYLIELTNTLVSDFDIHMMIASPQRPHETIRNVESGPKRAKKAKIPPLFRKIIIEPNRIERLYSRFEYSTRDTFTILPPASDADTAWSTVPQTVVVSPTHASAVSPRHMYENAMIIVNCQISAINYNMQFIMRDTSASRIRHEISQSVVQNTYVIHQVLPIYIQVIRYFHSVDGPHQAWEGFDLPDHLQKKAPHVSLIKQIIQYHSPTLTDERADEFWKYVGRSNYLMRYGCPGSPMTCAIAAVDHSLTVLLEALELHVTVLSRDATRLINQLRNDLKNDLLGQSPAFAAMYEKINRKVLRRLPPLSEAAIKFGAQPYAESLYESLLQIIEGWHLVPKCRSISCQKEHKQRYLIT